MNRQTIRKVLIIISFLLFPITIFYLSPVIILEGASKGIITGSFIVFTGLFLSSLFFGRAFCGWICPGAGIQECCTIAVNKKAAGGNYDLIKYVIWVPWVAAIAYLAILAGGFHSVNFFFLIDGGISVTGPYGYIIYYFFVGLIVLLSLTTGRRAFCHYVCWMAPFMVIGSKIKSLLPIPSLAVTARKEQCNDCLLCDRNCPMSLSVSKMVKSGSMQNTECILCGQCVDSCRRDAVMFTFGVDNNRITLRQLLKKNEIL